MSIGIAYNPCKNCKEMDKCSICELTYYRKGYIKSPTADVVEVVRCEDCKYCHHRAIPNNERYECEYFGCSDEAVDYVEPTHYCSYGERREDGT
jgi:hypothetical protein